jgi:CRP/FNR family cyclic AMP-dependent transcriptional regulator
MSADPPTGAASAADGLRHRDDWPGNSFLARLPEPALGDLLGAGRAVRYGKGRRLIEEGDDATEVFLLLSAGVKVTAELGGGRQALLAVRLGGDVVGELSGADGETRLATVTACGREPVIAVVVQRADFDKLLDNHHEARKAFDAAVSRKLRTATRRRIDFAGYTSEIRLARALAELADDYGRQVAERGTVIRINLTQIELGTLVGVSEATAQRSLRTLRQHGLVRIDGRRPIIPDLAALRAAGEESWWE